MFSAVMIRAIIADDHAFFRIVVRTILEERGDIEVYEASDGAEAVAKALKLKPDVVILDLNMPVMSGYEAAAELRRLLPGIPILLFSTQSRAQLAADARSIGVQGFVNKTDANRALLQAVDDVVVNKGTFFPDSSKTEVLTP
jgi:DNA-binding NarL/FixJ family response regulator